MRRLAYSPDGSRIAVFAAIQSPLIRVYDAETGALSVRPSERRSAGQSRRIPSGRLEVDRGGEATIEHWDLSSDRDATGARRRSRLPMPAVWLSDDGTRVAIVARGRNGKGEEVTVFDAATGATVSRYSEALPPRPSMPQLLRLVFSPNTARLAAWWKRFAGSGELTGAEAASASVRIWDTATGRLERCGDGPGFNRRGRPNRAGCLPSRWIHHRGARAHPRGAARFRVQTWKLGCRSAPPATAVDW